MSAEPCGVERPRHFEYPWAELELTATKGKVRVEASDDVDLVGETIHLN